MEELKRLVRVMIGLLNNTVELLKRQEVTEAVIRETIAEVYEETASTKEDTIEAPIFKGKKVFWNWLYVKNTGGTNNCKIGLNGDTEGGFTLPAGESRTLSYKDLKIKYIRYKAVEDTTTIQLIPMRPRSNYE